MTNLDLTDLRAEGVRLLRLYQDTIPEERTPVVRALAKVIVAARAQIPNDAGEPDYRGLTRYYRDWVHGLYTRAQVPLEARKAVQAAVRYHVGSVLRDQVDHETLERLGLLKQSPKERSTARNAARSARLAEMVVPQEEPERAGEPYTIHVYQGDRPVATFFRAEEAAAFVAALERP